MIYPKPLKKDSITEIIVPELQDDYEYCLNCGGQRTSKLRKSGIYSTVCQAWGTYVKKLKPHAITHKNRNCV